MLTRCNRGNYRNFACELLTGSLLDEPRAKIFIDSIT